MKRQREIEEYFETSNKRQKIHDDRVKGLLLWKLIQPYLLEANWVDFGVRLDELDMNSPMLDLWNDCDHSTGFYDPKYSAYKKKKHSIILNYNRCELWYGRCVVKHIPQ